MLSRRTPNLTAVTAPFELPEGRYELTTSLHTEPTFAGLGLDTPKSNASENAPAETHLPVIARHNTNVVGLDPDVLSRPVPAYPSKMAVVQISRRHTREDRKILRGFGMRRNDTGGRADRAGLVPPDTSDRPGSAPTSPASGSTLLSAGANTSYAALSPSHAARSPNGHTAPLSPNGPAPSLGVSNGLSPAGMLPSAHTGRSSPGNKTALALQGGVAGVSGGASNQSTGVNPGNIGANPGNGANAGNVGNPGNAASQGNARKNRPPRPPKSIKNNTGPVKTLESTLKGALDPGLYAVVTYGKGIVLSALDGPRTGAALVRIVFSAFPTAVDIRRETAADGELDAVVGFSSGEIVWLDLVALKYARINREGSAVNTPVTCIRALQGGTQVMTGHSDGALVSWDLTYGDSAHFAVPSTAAYCAQDAALSGEVAAFFRDEPRDAPLAPGTVRAGLREMLVAHSGSQSNPVSYWRVSECGVNDFDLDMGGGQCAVVSDDGCLRLISMGEKRITHCFSSYFGPLLTVLWSDNGRFLLSAGQDDMVTVIVPSEERLIARCIGHQAWVKDVAWDHWSGDAQSIRFVSAGEDCRVCFWDLSSATIKKPVLPRSSNPTKISFFYPPPSQNEVPTLEPMLSVPVTNDILTQIVCLEDTLVCLTQLGQLRVWKR